MHTLSLKRLLPSRRCPIERMLILAGPNSMPTLCTTHNTSVCVQPPRLPGVYAASTTSRQMRKGSYIVTTEVFNTPSLPPSLPSAASRSVTLYPPLHTPARSTAAASEIPTRFALLMQSHYPRKERGDSFGESTRTCAPSSNNNAVLFIFLAVRPRKLVSPRCRVRCLFLIGMRSFIRRRNARVVYDKTSEYSALNAERNFK